MEEVAWRGALLATILKAADQPDQTTFLTPPDLNQQVGFIVYPKGGVIRRHLHRPLERNLVGTSEVIFVREGRCEVDIFSEDRHLAATRELGPGDLILLMRGGHGMRILEDTVLLEVKLGPYIGPEEKELF